MITLDNPQVTKATNLANFVSKIQDERFRVVFAISTENFTEKFNESHPIQKVFSETDEALNELVEWRDIEGHKL